MLKRHHFPFTLMIAICTILAGLSVAQPQGAAEGANTTQLLERVRSLEARVERLEKRLAAAPPQRNQNERGGGGSVAKTLDQWKAELDGLTIKEVVEKLGPPTHESKYSGYNVALWSDLVLNPETKATDLLRIQYVPGSGRPIDRITD